MANITKADVSEAIDKLRELNLNPSNNNIQSILGRGSNSTINKYRQQILEEDGNNINHDEYTPEGEVNAIVDLLSKLVDKKSASAKQSYEKHIAQLRDTINELEEELGNKQLHITKLEQTIKTLEEENSSLQQDVIRLLKSKDKFYEEYTSLVADVNTIKSALVK